MTPTISFPAAVLFLPGAVVTWIAFNTEPPAGDLRSLAGVLGFVAMAVGCALQAKRIHDEVQSVGAGTAEKPPPDNARPGATPKSE